MLSQSGFQFVFHQLQDDLSYTLLKICIHCAHIMLGLQQYSSLTILSPYLSHDIIHFRQHKNLRNRIYEIRSIKYLNMEPNTFLAAYLDLYVLGDEILTHLGSLMETKHLCVLIHIRNKGEVAITKHI